MRDSNKRLGILKEIQWEAEEEALNLIQPLDIRWYSHYKALFRVRECYPQLCLILKVLSTEHKNPMAAGYLKKLEKLPVSTYLMITGYLDVVRILDKVSTNFQRKGLTLNDSIIEIGFAKSSLGAKPASQGTLLAKTYEAMKENPGALSFITGLKDLTK